MRARTLVAPLLGAMLACAWAGAPDARAAAPKAAKKPPTKDELAREHFRAGEALHKLGRHDEAIREFMEGYVLVPLPAFLLNIAQAYRLAGNPAKAKEFYGKYLIDEPKSPRRAEIERLMAEMDEAIARARTAPVKPVEPAAATTAAPAPPAPRAGSAALTAPAPEATARPRPARPGLLGRWWFWTLAGVVAIGGGAGITGGLWAAGVVGPREGSLDTIDLRP